MGSSDDLAARLNAKLEGMGRDEIPAQPARTVVRFARCIDGATGRFDLCVYDKAGAKHVVRPQLSRTQAEAAAAVVNEALGSWLA